jgi:hypothetical protein
MMPPQSPVPALLLLYVRMLLAHLNIKGAICWVQVLRPADERHPWLIIITLPEGLTSILRVSHLRTQQQYTRSGHTAPSSTWPPDSNMYICTQLLLFLLKSLHGLQQCQHPGAA